MEVQGDFYLPPCSRPKCNNYLHEMAQAIIRLNSKLVLVTKDPPNNSIEESFKKSYLDCAFTILHKCKHFWKGIQPLERYILKDSSKVMCVAFRKDLRRPYEQTERHHVFFKHLHIHDASTASSLNSFLHLAFESLYEKHPAKRNKESEEDKQDLNAADEKMGRDYRFVQWPDLFNSSNPTDVFVLNSFLNTVENPSLQCSSSIAKLEEEARDMSLPNVKTFFLKILPKMYSEGAVEGLAFLTCCDHHQLANASVLLLQLLLLEKEPLNFSRRINELIVAEGFLWRKLFTLRQSLSNVGFESSTFFLRLAVTYAMVLCSFVLLCVKKNKLLIASTHLDTIDGRLLPPIQVQDEDIIHVCKWFDSFVKDMVQRKSKSYKDILQNLEIEQDELSVSDQVNCVDQKPLSIQTLVAYEALKEIFLSMSMDQLTFLDHYIKKRKDVSNATTETIFQGLALFLVFQLKKKGVADVMSFCCTAMEILENKLSPQTQNAIAIKRLKIDPLMQMLFFNSNPTVRADSLKYLKPVVDGKENIFSKKQGREALIQNEVLRVLYPVMREMEKIDNPYSFMPQAKGDGPNWLIYKGKFGDVEARIHLYLPRLEHLQNKLKTSIGDDGVFYHEMSVLAEMQHENIVEMFAFQRRCLPLFFVLEHHNDLQTALKDTFESQSFFDKSDLARYLLQALLAVKFCHSKSIVHRNLTAKSLLMVDHKTVKLSGFHLCLKMTSGEAIGTVLTNSMIPTRWSAPESLNDNKYSVASDVWMFGHLMYEVLTYGGLPYADMEEGLELMNKIKNGEIHLCPHPLIQSDHYNIITRCTNLSQESRPDLTVIKKALEQRKEDHVDIFQRDKVDYDDFQDGHKASTNHGKGVPTNANPVYREDLANANPVLSVTTFSDILTKHTEEHVYIFREKLGSMPSRVRVELRKGALQHILPYLSIKESPKEMPHAECVIPRLTSRITPLGAHVNKQSADTDIDESLEKVALDKLFGKSITLYLACLYQVAVLLEKLHSESWVIGDMSMPLIHVQWKSQEESINVYLVSVGYLQKYDPDIDVIKNPSKDPIMVSRAAPEVVEHDMYSLGSDIYCFGNLMWQTCKALDCPLDKKAEYKKEQMEYANFKHEKVSEKWENSHAKPNNCPDGLYDLMKQCTQHNSSTRISAQQLTQELKKFMQRI